MGRGPGGFKPGWVCQYQAFPAYKWFASSDDTDVFPGVVCARVDRPPPGGNYGSWAGWWKIARLVTQWPW